MSQGLYKEAILRRSRTGTYRYRMANPTLSGRKKNPLCGDDVTLYLRLEGGTVEELSFEGRGCALAMAASDLLCENLKKKSVDEAKDLVERYISLLRDGKEENRFEGEDFGAMEAVRSYPSRIDCAVLAWEIADELLQE